MEQNIEKYVAKEDKKITFKSTCAYCGKTFESENFFIDVCPKCQDDYVNFLVRSHKKVEKDWY